MEGRGNVYQNLIFAAQKVLEETGKLPATPQALAEASGVGEEDVENIFGSTDELLEGLLYHSVTLLNDAVRQGVIDADTADPLEQMRAIGHAYLTWADRNPSLFRLVVTGLNGEVKPDSTLYRFTTSMRDLYHRKLAEMQRLGKLSATADIEICVMMLHCLVKGGNMMFLTRDTDPWFADDSRPTPVLAELIFSEFLKNLAGARNPEAVPG
ncbi:DNA-binding transcriptional regulator, AcrR family [Paracoccus halophilus]|uniref:DNA-binding transcriptional regulator, AcrR family n=1 Tax=Paracoccus halophilus TaxID=376733 RepID=A0A1I0SW39_9RHOB|nr:TetR/AcrR family transcriptional regulator [Paracoccus halophilus]SFA43719.1 DNA-binding transcriptional regulator, AcrR family [Paracoccus halophilus]